MKFLAMLLGIIFIFAAGDAPQTSIPYFTNVREVNVAKLDRQNFIVVDEEIWNHARYDLGDLRIYSGDSPVQYFLSEQNATVSSDEVDAKILNLGSVSGHTEFDLDAGSLTEYDRIHLRLDAKDFVVSASVSGESEPGKPATALTPTTLYDFTSEQLGGNSVLKIPPSSFRYLHISLAKGIFPQQVIGASIYNLRQQQASWTTVGSCASPQEKQRTTVIVCTLPAKVPLSRIQFKIAPAQVNVRRVVSVEDSKGLQVASGEIERVRVNRAGALVSAEEMDVKLFGGYSELTIKVENGDNPPLQILSVQVQALERRIYFDPQGKASPKLYYGDEKIPAPVYDYARFFHLDASPAPAQLGAGEHNPQYTPRPDERPWSEQHPAVLWIAMILAVVLLTLLAVRGLRAQPH